MLQREIVTGAYSFYSWEGDHLQLNQPVKSTDQNAPTATAVTRIDMPCIVYRKQLVTEGVGNSAASFDLSVVDILANLDAEVILVGTGQNIRFPTQDIVKRIADKGLAIDFMDSAAACRTYNILAAEGRLVAALIYFS